MKTAPFLDFHTHTEKPNSVYNLMIRDKVVLSPDSDFFSAGIHPWYISSNLKEQFELLEEILKLPEVLFIGECGLDRLKGSEMTFQIEVFKKQIVLAEHNEKPVIIHCVRAYSELLHLRKLLKQQMPWIIHGFNTKPQLAQQALDSGCYLSLGKALLIPESNAVSVLRTIPLTRLFLETDDSTIPIEHIYRKAAEILNVTPTFLSDQILINFERIISKSIL
jgi:TatD DNase family protein